MMQIVVPCLLSIFLVAVLTSPTLARHQRHHRFRSLEGGGIELRSYFRDPLKNSRSVPREENCPVRNDYQVRAKGLSCVRRCNVDADCQNDRKLCLCDGLCGLSCIRPEKECPELPDPANGQVHLHGRHFQDEARYTCNEGYQLVGVEKSYCQASGRWSGIPPTCKEFSADTVSPYYCGQPPRIENANHNGSEDQTFWDLDTQLTYQCFPGFKRDGFDHAKCFYMNGTATWYGPDLHCKPIECGPAEEIQNGFKYESCTSYRCQVKYDCRPGFKLRGRDTRICERSGIWTQMELPICEAVQCSLPRNPVNGKALFTSVSYKSVVSYECNYGYMIVGNATRMCESEREWSGDQPECKEINCGPPGGGHIPNGWLEGSRTSMHSVVVFKCLEGMILEGHQSTTCGPGGRWSNPVPNCLAPCIIPEIEHGQSMDTRGQKIPHGNTTTVVCEQNYETFSNSTPIKCNNGTWTQIPKCFPARCKSMPQPPKNGMIVVPKVSHGSIGLFQCKDGYRLIGRNTTFCNFGNWTQDTPDCQEIYCPFPGYLPNGKVLLVGNMGLYDYRPYVKRISNDRQIMFDCDKEYRLEEGGPRGATCVDGQWSPNFLPTCLPDNHPNIRWLDKRETKSSEIEEILAELKMKTWNNKKMKKAKRSLEIRRRKRDTTDEDDCQRLDSAALMIEVTKMGKVGPEYFRNGANIKVECSEGYGLRIPKSKYKCRRGDWKPRTPVCVQEQCLVPAVENGVVEVVGADGEATPAAGGHAEDGVEVRVLCDPGYRLVGSSSMSCSRGRWSNGSSEMGVSSLASCTPSPCSLPIIEHGYYSQTNFSVGSQIEAGQTISYQCLRGYTRVGRDDPVCQAGQLSPQPPTCLQNFTRASDEVYLVDNHVQTSWATSFCNDPLLQAGQLDLVSNPSSGDDRPDRKYPHGASIDFGCLSTDSGAKMGWSIRCVSGEWRGNYLPCSQTEAYIRRVQGMSRSCLYEPRTPNLVAFYKDKEITEDLYLSSGDVVLFRCSDIGKYKLVGNRRLVCGNGNLQGEVPLCTPLSQHYDYALDKPPTILFRHQKGPIAQTNTGELLVYPGTILHMECLFIKKFGTPTWSTRRVTRRVYPQGWAMDRMRDSTLEYRLSIYHATLGDTGEYTCTTPAGQQTTVNIVVDNVTCPHIPLSRHLLISSNETHVSKEVVFTCSNGNQVIGPEKLTCLSTGSWSAIPPACEDIACPRIETVIKDPHLSAEVLSYSSGGRVRFSCSKGFSLVGDSAGECSHLGNWTLHTTPRCTPILCAPPDTPENGALQTQGPFRVGDVARFVCNKGHIMEGESVTACVGEGTWSHSPPACLTACSYPGTPPGGYLDKVQFYYKVGDKVTFSCNHGLLLTGPKLIKCQESGHWSGTVPSCTN